MTAASGTKLETNRTGRTAGICRALLVMAGLAVVSGVSRAGDIPAGLGDPTRPSYVTAPAGVKAAERRGPVLESTFVSVSRRRAVISGRTYTVGDKFDGGVISDIQPYEVTWKRGGHEVRLRLLPKLAKDAWVAKVPAHGQEGGHDK